MISDGVTDPDPDYDEERQRAQEWRSIRGRGSELPAADPAGSAVHPDVGGGADDHVVTPVGEAFQALAAGWRKAVQDLFDDVMAVEPEPDPAEALREWWWAVTDVEIAKVVPKAVEYGANSLRDVGYQMARMAGREVSDEEAQELAVYFYIVGKMGRWADSLARGERVSDDTLHDIGVYARMAQRIRAVGGWPHA